MINNLLVKSKTPLSKKNTRFIIINRLMHDDIKMSNAFAQWATTRDIAFEHEAMKQFEYIMNALETDSIKISHIITGSYNTLGYFIGPESFFFIFESMYATILEKTGIEASRLFLDGLFEMDDLNAFSRTDTFLLNDPLIRKKFWEAYFSCTDSYIKDTFSNTNSTTSDTSSNDEEHSTDDKFSVNNYVIITLIISLFIAVGTYFYYKKTKEKIDTKEPITPLTTTSEKEDNEAFNCVLENEFFYIKVTLQLVLMLVLPTTFLWLYTFRYYYFYLYLNKINTCKKMLLIILSIFKP